MPKFTKKLFVFSIFVVLSACSNALQSAKEKDDIDHCLITAQIYQNTFKPGDVASVYKTAQERSSNTKLRSETDSSVFAVKRLKNCAAILEYTEYKSERQTIAQWHNWTLDYYYKKEKEEFLKATNGKKLCVNNSISALYFPNAAKPTSECIYQNKNELVASQITDKGILVQLSLADAYPELLMRRLFVYKNAKDKDVADDAPLESGYFEYKGLFSYQSLTGQRTVYSFARIKNNLPQMNFYNGRD